MALEVWHRGHTVISLSEEEAVTVSLNTLKAIVADATYIAPENQKLIVKGRILSTDDDVTSLPAGSKVTLIGSTQEDIEQAQRTPEHIVNDVLRRPFSVSARELTAQPKVHPVYRFHDVQILPGLPQQDTAMQILQSLATDPGVLAVLEEHQWSVGMLCELYPEGYVGVSEVCVLGLNENKGQKIKLRIRTDDLKGFRKILTIKKVLFHELAHMEHSNHDNDFYVLMRQVEREYDELDWRKSRARTVGSDTVYRREDNSVALFEGGSGRLGGDETFVHNLTASEAAGAAVVLRFSQEQHSAHEAKECDMCAGDHSPTHLDTFAEHEVGAEEQKQNYEETNAHENLDSVPVVSMEVDQSDEDHRKESVAYQNLVRERLRYIWEDMAPLANASGLDLSDARLIGLRTSIQELVQRLSYTEMQETLGVLMTLISNAMQYGHDSKYTTIKKTNKKISRTVVSRPAALMFLRNVGFSEVVGNDSVMTLRRRDEGLLWLGKAILERCVEV